MSSGNVLLDLFKLEHAERVRRAEREQLFVDAVRAAKRPSLLKSVLLFLAGN
jgi:hypothetical protein